MAAPPGRVFALPVSARLGGIEDRLHASPHAAGSFGLNLPDRLKDFQDVNAIKGCIIPQQVYSAPQPFDPYPKVEFKYDGFLGFKLSDALSHNYAVLDGANEVPQLADTAKKTTMRILVSVSELFSHID